ncbi:hypothetical protein PV773_11840 [Mesorhizobium sp. CC13]|uniref:hypothetical protein n=1 Tax=Mesorhizobium sp. CC13 TaxID=3029194 RepID=UPI00326503E7
MTRKRHPEEPIPDIEIGGSPAPLSLHNAIALALSIAATQDGAHQNCPRRECRSFGRCRASPTLGRSRLCGMPFSREAERRVVGMLMFALQLANGWR